LGNAGLKATDVPVVAFSVGEEELRGVDTKPLVGHLAAWNYFMSLKNPANDEFKKKWAAYTKKAKLPNADRPLTNDPMEAAYVGINMWKQAVEKAKSTDVDKVIAAMAGQTFKAPDGFTIKMDEKNHHLHKPVFIGAVLTSSAMAAIAPQTIRDLAFGESDDKIKAIGALSASGDPEALPLLQALLDGEMQSVGENQVLLVKGEQATDLLTGQIVTPLPENRDDIVVNNRVRKTLGTAMAAAKLFAPDRSARLAAAKELQNAAHENTLAAITTAPAKVS